MKINTFRKNAEGGGGGGEEKGGGEEGTKTCLDTDPRARPHRTQRKHKHETRFPGWGFASGITPPTSDTQGH